jgi:hypothetical protein
MDAVSAKILNWRLRDDGVIVGCPDGDFILPNYAIRRTWLMGFWIARSRWGSKSQRFLTIAEAKGWAQQDYNEWRAEIEARATEGIPV